MADDTLLQVRVTPRARRNAIGVMKDGVLAVRLAAPPVEGAANKALIAFLAETLGVPKSRIRIESGEHGRLKRLRILGVDPAIAIARISAGA